MITISSVIFIHLPKIRLRDKCPVPVKGIMDISQQKGGAKTGMTAEKSNIQPIRQFHDQGAVLYVKVVDTIVDVIDIIIGIHNEKIGHRLEAPLKTAVDIDVIKLAVILDKSSEENTFAKGKV